MLKNITISDITSTDMNSNNRLSLVLPQQDSSLLFSTGSVPTIRGCSIMTDVSGMSMFMSTGECIL